MDADWITSPRARRVLQHAADSRPAWLWSQDGQLLLWQNDAAQLYLAKLKKHGLKLAPPAVPIKGQIARNVRLGSLGRTSLARIQFIAGDKPASSTCATTPLTWQDGQTVLLVVGVDPIAPEILAAVGEAADAEEAQLEAALPQAQDETIAPEADQPTDETPVAETDHSDGAAQDDIAAAREALDEPEHPDAQDDGADRPLVTDEVRFAQELENWRSAEPDGRATLELVTAPADDDEGQPDVPDAEEPAPSRLSLLVDRLAADDALFTPLTEADDEPPEGVAPERFDQPEPGAPADVPPDAPAMFTITGQGFLPEAIEAAEPSLVEAPADESDTGEPPLEESPAETDVADLAALDGIDEPVVAAEAPAGDVEGLAEAFAELAPEPPADPESVERASRYNFDELARILTDRVGDQAAAVQVAAPATPARTGALINLGGETLVLNRLPLGIMVFRDQQVLFANRAITEMVGYESVESLRAAGLGAVFPATGPDGEADAGPVNHLVQRDGTFVPVTARLQSISWQGKPALMLSASTTEVRTGHEAAVSAFARTFADLRGDGYFEATRAGIIGAITPRGAALLKQDGMLEGKPLSALVGASELDNLRDFLERPARFAETARPVLTLRSVSGSADLILFAQGQAGIVTGYFGFVRERDSAPVRLSGPSDADPALLSRISRGVRRPLNTIIGFADLLRSEAFGAPGDERYESYAEDIASAGQEIGALVDELDDYARLRDGRYLPQRASIELTSLLESCVLRIRQQASNARVIVRNAISENLPRVTADRASLAQAVLNLLASAIDQTPSGGGVVISAQREDHGGISVHVRDSSTAAVDMAERFVVFRDGPGRDGQMMVPVRSSIGLALTRSLLAVNAFSLSVDPAGEQGMLFTMVIPADLVEQPATPADAE